jgi:hypothetical protein
VGASWYSYHIEDEIRMAHADIAAKGFNSCRHWILLTSSCPWESQAKSLETKLVNFSITSFIKSRAVLLFVHVFATTLHYTREFISLCANTAPEWRIPSPILVNLPICFAACTCILIILLVHRITKQLHDDLFPKDTAIEKL